MIKTSYCFLFICIFSLFLASFSLRAETTQPFDYNVCIVSKSTPYQILTQDRPKGIDLDILSTIVKKSTLRVSVEIMSELALLYRLRDGNCHIALGLADEPAYREFADFIFTVPLYYSSSSLFLEQAKPEKINSIGHLFNLKLAHIKDMPLSIGLEQAINDQRLERLTFPEMDKGYQLLEKQLVDAILADDVSFRYVLKTKNSVDKFRRIDISFLPHTPSFIALSRTIDGEKRANLKGSLSEILKQMHLSGHLSNIMKSYVY